MQTDIVGVTIGIVGIVIGIIVSYYFYRKSLREKAPYWAISSNNLIQGFSSKVQDLQVIFQEKKVENLTISKILFWNNGAETIDKDDIGTINHIRIIPKKNILLLDGKILASNNESSQFNVRLNEDENCAYLDFAYLDEKQGAVIQIIHTGTSSQDLEVVGKIKGVKTIYQRTLTPKWVKFIGRLKPNSKESKELLGFFGMGLGIAYIVVSAIRIIPSPLRDLLPSTEPTNPQSTELFNSLLTLLSGILLFLMAYVLMRQVNIAPKGLEVFDKD